MLSGKCCQFVVGWRFWGALTDRSCYPAVGLLMYPVTKSMAGIELIESPMEAMLAGSICV